MTLPHIIKAAGVNEAFSEGIKHLLGVSAPSDSRNGLVMVSPGPVITATENPMQRVLFSPLRDANPFFHLFESLWMLAGRNDLPWLAQFNKQMGSYSDDGGRTQPAAYGCRWRKHFRYDQLEAIIAHLIDQPNSRRAVLTMWDAWPMNTDEDGTWVHGDVEKAFGGVEKAFGGVEKAFGGGKDVPCNTNCFFGIRDGEFLDMSVQCRSNDAIWGAHGANAVHFSVLLEYMAARLDLIPGVMYQYSFNYHLYPDNVKADLADMARNAEYANAYRMGQASTTPLFCSETVGGVWERELAWFMYEAAPVDFEGGKNTPPIFTEPFFCGIALPMLRAWRAHKAKDYATANREIETMPPRSDWAIACGVWLAKRRNNWERQQNGDA